MNELPTEERCRAVIHDWLVLGLSGWTEAERSFLKDWGSLRGVDNSRLNDQQLAERILADHYGAASTLPERDEATGTGPATQDRPADIWRDNPPATVTQRDGKPEPKLELTPEERWHSQMNRSEAMITKQERLQHEEERLQIQREQQQDKFERILAQAEKVLVSFIAKIGGPATAAEIERTHELAKDNEWEENERVAKIVADREKHEASIRHLRAPSRGGYTKDQEIRELRYLVDEQKAIIKELEKRLEAGRKRGQMVRDLLSKEV